MLVRGQGDPPEAHTLSIFCSGRLLTHFRHFHAARARRDHAGHSTARLVDMEAKEASDWVRFANGAERRFEACFTGRAYQPHRHDTYTVALTLQGVQSFDYRGRTCHSKAGNVLVLHPDELHDGRAGTDAPFRYRAIDIEPRLIQEILGGASLPFINGAITADPEV